MQILVTNDDGVRSEGIHALARALERFGEVQARSAVKILFGHDRPMYLAGGVENWTHSSDQGPFADAGVPFVYFGVEDHADYHRPTDTADKINRDFYGSTVDMIVEAIRTFDRKLP